MAVRISMSYSQPWFRVMAVVILGSGKFHDSPFRATQQTRNYHVMAGTHSLNAVSHLGSLGALLGDTGPLREG